MSVIKIDLSKLKKNNNKNKNPEDSFLINKKEQDVVQKKELSNKHCPFCGSQIEAGEKKCHLCGNNINEIVEDNQDDNFAYITKKRSKFYIILVIIIILSLLSMYIFYPFYRYTFKNKKILDKRIEYYVEEEINNEI